MFRGELWVWLHSGVLLKVTDRQRTSARTQTLIAKSQKEDKSLNLGGSLGDFQ